MSHIPLIFIIAGEASGDQLGADLMASLNAQQEVRFAGIGGPAMTAQGLTSLFPMEELSIMGIAGILRNLPSLLRRINETVSAIQEMKPDVVITIDAQEFSFCILKRLHKLKGRPRLIHYVAPTVWAWRPGRARKIATIVDRLLCLYPFEPPYFEKYGLKTVFVGHPVARGTEQNKGFESQQLNTTRSSSRASEGGVVIQETKLDCDVANAPRNDALLTVIQRNPNLLCLLPGSRRSEIQTLLPIFGETVRLLKYDIPDLKVVIPTLSSLKPLIEEETREWPLDVQIIVGDQERHAAFQKASVALAASGTVALQLAAANLPFIIAYKVGKITEWGGRLLIKTPWVCMVNILMAFRTFQPDFILNRKAQEKVKEPWIPEFLQNDCIPENLKTALLKLIKDPATRKHQEQAMDKAIHLLKAPSQTAAKNVLEEIASGT